MYHFSGAGSYKHVVVPWFCNESVIVAKVHALCVSLSLSSCLVLVFGLALAICLLVTSCFILKASFLLCLFLVWFPVFVFVFCPHYLLSYHLCLIRGHQYVCLYVCVVLLVCLLCVYCLILKNGFVFRLCISWNSCKCHGPWVTDTGFLSFRVV